MQHRNPLLKASLYGGFILTLLVSLVSFAAAQTCLKPPSGMTSWWPGDGNTDDIVGDLNAVLHGNATTNTNPGFRFVGGVFVLNGAGDFVSIPDDPALEVGSGDFTVDLWVNFNDTAGEQILVEKYVEDFSGNAPGWSFAKLSNNALVVAPNSPQTPPLSLQPNTWYHFAARRSSGNITIFVDGTKMASGPLGSGGNADTDSSLKFGHRGSPGDTPGSSDNRGFFLNGLIDEVELFVGRALDDKEIKAISDVGRLGKCKRTVMLDAGHGQIFTAGVWQYQRPPSPTYGLREDNLTLDMAQHAKSTLKEMGYRVMMTRTGVEAPFAPANCGVPCGIDLAYRRLWAEYNEVDVLVSIHTNADDNPQANGTSAFYEGAGNNSSALASLLIDSVSSLLATTDRGSSLRNLRVLSPNLSSSLIEVAFHTNSQLAAGQAGTDEAILNDPDSRKIASFGIEQAIDQFFEVHP